MKKLLILTLLIVLLTACKAPILTDDTNSADGSSVIDIDEQGDQPRGIDLNLNNYVQDTEQPNQNVPRQGENKTQTGPENIFDPDTFDDLTSQYDQARIKTNAGYIQIAFYNEDAPETVNNFMNLANRGFYTGTTFHRVIKDFMIQGGDPNSKDANWADDGRGGPGYRFDDEINDKKIVQGSVAMANSGPDTNGSQFFIVTAEETPWLDGKHTNFGEIVGGMNTVNIIASVETNENDHPMQDIIIQNIELIKSE